MLQDLPLLGRDICCSDISGGCVRSVVPKKFYLNLVWSQMYTFVVYTAVPVLVTFIIFCKGDQQPPVPDSIPISSGKWYLLCLTIPMAEFHSPVLGAFVSLTRSGRHKHLSLQLPTVLSPLWPSSAQWALITDLPTSESVQTHPLPPSSWAPVLILQISFPSLSEGSPGEKDLAHKGLSRTINLICLG